MRTVHRLIRVAACTLAPVCLASVGQSQSVAPLPPRQAQGAAALGAIVGTWQSDVVDGQSALSSCVWTPQRAAVLCEQTISSPAGERRALNLFTFDQAAHKYFLYVVAEPGKPSATVPLAIEGTQWIYGGGAGTSGERRFRTINDFSKHDSYEWRTESSVDGEQWTRVTGGHSKRIRSEP